MSEYAQLLVCIGCSHAFPLQVLGKRLGPAIKEVGAAVKGLSSEDVLAMQVSIGDVQLAIVGWMNSQGLLQCLLVACLQLGYGSCGL